MKKTEFSFIEQKLQDLLNTNLNNKEDSTDIQRQIKDDQRYKFIIFAFVILEIIYATYVIICFVRFRENELFQLCCNIAILVLIFIFLIVVIKTKNMKRLQTSMKYITFLLCYANQVMMAIYLILTESDEHRILRNFYLLQLIVNYYAVWFFQFNYYILSLVAGCNCGILIWFQIKNPYSHFYLGEIVLSLLLPAAAFIQIREYNQIFDKLFYNIKLKKAFANFIESLLDQLPCFYFTFSGNEVVFTNHAFQQYLVNNYHSLDISPKEENPHLFIKNNNYKRALEFLLSNKFVYINPSFKTFLNSQYNLNEEENILEILFSLSKLSTAKDGIAVDHFDFLGIIERCAGQEEKKHQFNFYLRKMVSTDSSWIEVIMTDVTLSQNIQLVDKIYSMRENMLSKIAHEFKTPLMCITNLTEEICELVENKESDFPGMEQYKKKIHDVKNFSNYTLVLIHDIIHFFRNNKMNSNHLSTNGNQVIMIKEEPFYLMDILKFCYSILETLLIYTHDKIRYIKPILESDFDCEIISDSFRIKQILLNLISNAVKFTKSGFIKLQAKQGIHHNSDIIINIIDTGMGIKEEDHNKIFSEEKMLESHIKENEMGSGLGLSFSLQIAELCGYHLTFNSIENIGTTFSLAIPAYKTKIVHTRQFSNQVITTNSSNNFLPNRKSSSPSSIKTRTEEILDFDNATHFIHDLKLPKKSTERSNEIISSTSPEQIQIQMLKLKFPKSVLIIDDNDLILNSVELILKKCLLKYNIHNVDIIRGYDGIDFLKEITKDQKYGNKIAFSLVDENMEFLDGSVALQILRQLERTKKIRKAFVCRMSAVNRGNEDLYDDLVDKPISFVEIEQLLTKYHLI